MYTSVGELENIFIENQANENIKNEVNRKRNVINEY